MANRNSATPQELILNKFEHRAVVIMMHMIETSWHVACTVRYLLSLQHNTGSPILAAFNPRCTSNNYRRSLPRSPPGEAKWELEHQKNFRAWMKIMILGNMIFVIIYHTNMLEDKRCGGDLFNISTLSLNQVLSAEKSWCVSCIWLEFWRYEIRLI